MGFPLPFFQMRTLRSGGIKRSSCAHTACLWFTSRRSMTSHYRNVHTACTPPPPRLTSSAATPGHQDAGSSAGPQGDFLGAEVQVQSSFRMSPATLLLSERGIISGGILPHLKPKSSQLHLCSSPHCRRREGGWWNTGGQGCGCFHMWGPVSLFSQVTSSRGISGSNVPMTRSTAAGKGGEHKRVRLVSTVRG